MISRRGESGRRKSKPGRRRVADNDAARMSLRERRVSLRIRRVRAADVPLVIALDKRVTGIAKTRYWQGIFERYGRHRLKERFFLVAEPLEGDPEPKIYGFIIGELRAWEFGSSPCGWIFALSVEPGARLRGTGEALFNAISAEFKKAGVTTVRTMVRRDSTLPMLFFRGEGMMAGPYIQLEKELD
jgi:ribosomal protein S18 acetylase RimI-like enzyme